MKAKTQSASLTEVARQAGVSIATVSRVLNDSAAVVPATRERVLSSARTLGYVPDPRFRLMAKRRGRGGVRTGNVALMLGSVTQAEFIASPYYARLFWGVEEAVSACGCHLIVSNLRADGDRFVPNFVRDFKVDGVIAMTHGGDELLRRIDTLVPVVLLNCQSPQLPLPAVLPDNASGVRQALEYLVGLGHRRIAYFLIDDAPPGSSRVHHDARRTAFANFVRDWPLPAARSVVLPGRSKPLFATLYELLAGWQAAGELPTALLCSADVYALEFLKCAEALGIRVPEQLSLVGTDDTLPCEYVRPALTSVRQPLEAMGAAAAKLLFERLADPASGGVRVTPVYDVQLIKRHSCAAPPNSQVVV